MARIHRALRVAPLVWALSCSAPRARDLAEPATAEDLLPLPGAVTDGNAHRAVRQALQRHARSASDVHHRYGYAFREGGFVQLYEYNAIDRGRPFSARVYVDYAQVSSAAVRVFFDTALLRDRVEVTLRGRLRRWQQPLSPFNPVPELDQEPSTAELGELVLVFDDPPAADALAQALRLLRG